MVAPAEFRNQVRRAGGRSFGQAIEGRVVLRLVSMKVALAQFDVMIGDLTGNAESIRTLGRQAASAGADLLVLPELAILGYPPRDLLLREEVVPACEAAVERLAADLPLPTLVGSPRRVEGGSRPIANAVALCRDGRVEAWYDKMLLPTYDVFDEARWFEPGDAPLVFDLDVDGEHRRIGVLVCEDLWRAEDAGVTRRYDVDPVAMLRDRKCDLVVSPSASPFVAGKHRRHREILAAAAELVAAPVAMANQIGAHDDLVFDGGSMLVHPDGTIGAASPRFETHLEIVEVTGPERRAPVDLEPVEEHFHAIRIAIRDYVRGSGHASVLLGLSGGIDSALVVALAVAALGPEAVLGVLLPSRFSSEGSKRDARLSAEALGIRAEEISIETMHTAVASALDPVLRHDGEGLEGLADENVQARSRGLLLMALSNARRHLLLSTSNKSELAVGYSTLYGDMCGGLAPIGDLYKIEVFALSRWMNANHRRLGFKAPPIPIASIEKPPSAELRPDQRDDDSLPPYELLDAYLRGRIDDARSPEALIAEGGLDASIASRIEWLLATSEFKRHQATIIPKLSPRTFGRGREMPLVARWRP
ncbi:MAG: NAD+ synthase [Planctomycetaceae bacterium]|nr:NAD+ synthase [Planctomycetaceae bacterium]